MSPAMPFALGIISLVLALVFDTQARSLTRRDVRTESVARTIKQDLVFCRNVAYGLSAALLLAAILVIYFDCLT